MKSRDKLLYFEKFEYFIVDKYSVFSILTWQLREKGFSFVRDIFFGLFLGYTIYEKS